MVGDKDKAAAFGFRFGADPFLGLRNERRDEHSAIDGGVKPAVVVPFSNGRGIGPVNHYLILERAVEELEIAESLIICAGDIQIVDAPEVFRMGFAHCQPARIVAQISKEGVERAVAAQYLVIVAILENACFADSVIDGGFQSGYQQANRLRERLIHRQNEMNMIRHHRILQQACFWLEIGDIIDPVSHDLA